jgi:hypothetical protein
LTDEGAVVGATLNWNGESPRGYVFVQCDLLIAALPGNLISSALGVISSEFKLQLAADKLKSLNAERKP